jgi:hypothetical protein
LPSIPDILRGCKLFPCVKGSKHPATPDGWKDASDDPAQWAEWERLLPDCNWAVATAPSGLFVFDADPEGLETWESLKAKHSELRDAFTVKTPRGGFHAYFWGEGPSTASRIADGIDTRGGIRQADGSYKSGGYVLLPGSRTSDGEYIALGGAIQPLGSLSAIIPERKKGETHGLLRPPELDQPRNVQWAMDLIRGYVENGRISVQGKGGNNLAFQVAASVIDKAISPALCYELLIEHWNPHCQPPWDDWELETIVRNASTYSEDASGAKGFQSNADAFAHVQHLADWQPPESSKVERPRGHVLPMHDYADSVGDPTWLVPGFLPAQGIGMLFGPSGSYKSFVALDMGLCLAFGIAGQWGAPPVKNDVLFIAGEGPVATAKKRWPAWMDWQGQEFRGDHRFFILDRVPPYHDSQQWEGVKADLAKLNVKPSLVVIDTLARLLVGLDENSAKDTTMVTGFMENLARHYECMVLVVHHTGKEERKGARGSSALTANMDVVLQTSKREGGMELRVRKQKDADVPDDPYYFRTKEFAQSIVLERTETLAQSPKAGKPVAEWASREEVVAVLAAAGEPLSLNMLGELIARNSGVDPAAVRRELKKNKDLTWLQRGDGLWQIPEVDYDL